MTIYTKDDANEVVVNSIKSINFIEHRISRIANSWDNKDILYEKSFTIQDYDNIINFLKEFSFEKFEDLNKKERKEIFENLIKLLISFICDGCELTKKCMKLMKKAKKL